MRCRKPFRNFGCRQCIPCRITLRRIWTHRMVLESLTHASNSFATLTYDQENCPQDGSVNPRHTQLFLKRLRKELPPGSLRFFLVGEYGDQTQRPHYHAAFFGIGPEYEGIVRKAWGFGHVMLGDLTPASARYVAGYVTKKMTSADDARLNGRHPEFARMSRNPGIGAPAIPTLDKMLSVPLGLREIDRLGDVPTSLRQGASSMPLGRYLRDLLRKEMGFIDNGDNSLIRESWKDERDIKRCEEETIQMQALWLNYVTSPQSSEKPFHTYLEEVANQQVLNIESRFKSSKRKSL